MNECFAVLSDACTGATHVSCNIGVAVIVAFLADLKAGDEILAQLGRVLDRLTENMNGICPVAVVFEVVLVGDFLENFHHVRCFWVVFGAGTAFQRKIYGLFALAALGVVAFFGSQEPATFLRGVCDERNAQSRVECGNCVVEQVIGVAQQAVLAFLGAVALKAKVGVHLERLSGHDACDLVSAESPKFGDGLVANVLVGGGLGDGDEVVDGGVVGLLHERFPLEVVLAVDWAVTVAKRRQKTPFDFYQKAKKVYIDLIMWPIRMLERWWSRRSRFWCRGKRRRKILTLSYLQ